MKVNEVLNNVTLKLPGGGNLALKKYVPYITNGEEKAEGINTEFLDKVIGGELKHTPAAYYLEGYFENEHDMWSYRYLRQVGRYDDSLDFYNNGYKLFTPDELKEYINLVKKVWGNSGDDCPSINAWTLYKESDIQDGEFLITDVYINIINNENYTDYTNHPFKITAEMAYDGFGEEFGNFISEINEQKLYSYHDYYEWTGEYNPENDAPEIPDDIINEYSNYGGYIQE